MFGNGFVNSASGAGSTVIVCDALSGVPQASSPSHVTVMVPPHSSKLLVCTGFNDPLILQRPSNPLLYPNDPA